MHLLFGSSHLFQRNILLRKITFSQTFDRTEQVGVSDCPQVINESLNFKTKLQIFAKVQKFFHAHTLHKIN